MLTDWCLRFFWFQVAPGIIESMKVITKSNSDRIAKFAFDFAQSTGRTKVTAVHKANIM